MVAVPDMIGPAAQFIAQSNPQQGVNRAAQQAGAIGKAMEISPGYMSILGKLGNGPSPTSNPSPINAAMQALGAGAVGAPQEGVQNAPPAPRGAPEALSAAYGGGRQAMPQTYWAQLAAGFPRSGFGG